MTGSEPVLLADSLDGKTLPGPTVRAEVQARRLPRSAAALAAVDLIALAGAMAAAGRVSLAAVGYAVGVLVLLAAAGMLRLRICLRLSDQAGRILAVAAAPAVLLLPWLSAGHAWRLAAWSAGCLLAGRGLAYACVRIARQRGLLTEPALLVGAGETAVVVARLLREHPGLGLQAFGFAASSAQPVLPALPVLPGPSAAELPLPVLGAAADLPRLVQELGIRRVIVCTGTHEEPELVHTLRAARLQGADIVLVPDLHELGMAVPRACLDEICGIPVIPLRRPPGAGLIAKRAADIVSAALLLCLLGPVIVGLAAIIRVRSGGPAIFRQLRVTGAGRAAQILKLRTLPLHSNSDTCWSVPVESCTRFGRWLRVSHLDELPQLVNVLRGHMSLVGPRPERPYFAERFGRTVPGYRDRNRMQAGLTGLAQASGLHGDTSLADRIRFDNQYIEYWSPWLDLVIVARTVAKALGGALGGRP
jgi:lipopolysaccharide/colanic/teichoic acid biosynthesis glycosyltransferase